MYDGPMSSSSYQILIRCVMVKNVNIYNLFVIYFIQVKHTYLYLMFNLIFNLICRIREMQSYLIYKVNMTKNPIISITPKTPATITTRT